MPTPTGLIPESIAIDLVLSDFVIDDALGRSKQSCGFGAVAAGGFQRVKYHVLLIGRHGIR